MFRSLRGFVDSKSDHNLNSSQSMVLLMPFASNHEKNPARTLSQNICPYCVRKCFLKPHQRKSSVNQLTSFYIMGTLVVKGLSQVTLYSYNTAHIILCICLRPQVCNFVKKRLYDWVNITKFLRKSCFIRDLRQLLQKIFSNFLVQNIGKHLSTQVRNVLGSNVLLVTFATTSKKKLNHLRPILAPYTSYLVYMLISWLVSMLYYHCPSRG